MVAAGTAIVEGLDPGQSAEFTGFFVGDPAGGELEVVVPPSNWPGAEGAPAPAAEGNPNDAGTEVVTDEDVAPRTRPRRRRPSRQASPVGPSLGSSPASIR